MQQFAVKMPLLRVAHPTDEDRLREIDRIQKKAKPQLQDEYSNDFTRDISSKGIPTTNNF